MELSYWEEQVYFTNVQLTVIGGGIVGLAAAIHYKNSNPDAKVLVLERGILPNGASSKNAGFACFGSPSEILDDLSRQSENETFKLVEKRWKGLHRLRKLLGDKNICYKNYGSFEMFDNLELYGQCIEKLPYLNRKLKEITGEADVYKLANHSIAHFGFNNVSHLIKNRLEGQIHTGEMIKSLYQLALSKGVLVLSGVNAGKPEETGGKVVVKANGHEFFSKKVIVAVNGFAKLLFPELDVKPARAQVLVTEPIDGLKVKGTFHFDRGYYYFRNIDNRILFGGGRNLDFKGEETYEMGLTGQIQQSLEHYLETIILPGVPYKIAHRWSGIMGIGSTKTTIVKPVSPNIICAVRMGGMGVAIGTLIGEEASEMALGNPQD
jgi:gamma-glutamylputrescine oxidase